MWYKIYLLFALCVVISILIQYLIKLLPGKKTNWGYNQFGYHLFSSMWCSFAFIILLKGFIITGIIFWVSDLILTRPLYELLFVQKPITKENHNVKK
jgi:hypothetical protein